jgi:hypothetical protein
MERPHWVSSAGRLNDNLGEGLRTPALTGRALAWRWLKAIQCWVRERAELALECAALRHQVVILQRSRPRHRRFGPWDRLLWIFLSRYWPRWRKALVLVQAETVLPGTDSEASVCASYQNFGASGGEGGGRELNVEIRNLIRRMARDNVLWGVPRIRAELLMLGFNVSQATVLRHLRRCVRPRSPGWRSFLRTQLFSASGAPASLVRPVALVTRQQVVVVRESARICTDAGDVDERSTPASRASRAKSRGVKDGVEGLAATAFDVQADDVHDPVGPASTAVTETSSCTSAPIASLPTTFDLGGNGTRSGWRRPEP